MEQVKINSNRIDTIDIIKGFGILLVIFGHINTEGQLSCSFIYSFHMPLFFFFSGVVSHTFDNLKNELIKSFRSLYIPFAFFTFIDIILFAVNSFLNHNLNVIFLFKYSVKLLTGLASPYFNAPIWFIFSLFIIKFLFSIIQQIRYSKYLFVAVFFLCIGCCFFIDHFSIPYSLYTPTIISFPFFLLGYFFKDLVLQFIRRKSITFLLCFSTAFVFILLILECKLNVTVNIHVGTIGNFALFFVNSLLGIIFTILFSKLTDVLGNKYLLLSSTKKFLLFFGKNSIYVLVTHYCLTRHILPFVLEKFNLSDYLYSIPVEIIFFITTVLIMIPVCLFMGRYLSVLFGKGKSTDLKSKDDNYIR